MLEDSLKTSIVQYTHLGSASLNRLTVVKLAHELVALARVHVQVLAHVILVLALQMRGFLSLT
jgi:hypothetical protein